MKFCTYRKLVQIFRQLDCSLPACVCVLQATKEQQEHITGHKEALCSRAWNYPYVHKYVMLSIDNHNIAINRNNGSIFGAQ